MVAQRIQANYDNLQEMLKVFMCHADRTVALTVQVEGLVDQLQGGAWRGVGAESFYAEMRDLILPTLRRLEDTLQFAGEGTGKIHTILCEAEEEAARLFRGTQDTTTTQKREGDPAPKVTPTQGPPTSTPTPTPTPGFRLTDVAQEELSDFFSQRDTDIPADVRDKYLTNPQMMQYFQQTLALLASHVQSGGAPLTPQQFYDMCLTVTNDPGTALILSHNITKAMTRRDHSVIQWDKTNTNPLTYTFTWNGQTTTYTFDTSNFHRDALATYNGNPSVFYAMFSPTALGTSDGGDWYHYYLNAAGAYYAASGQMLYGVNRGSLTSSILDGTIDSTMGQMFASGVDSPAYTGWRYANSLSFLEGAKYGDTQPETSREGQIHRQGALYGLELAGVQPDSSWRWYVPTAGAAGSLLDTTIDLANDTYQIFDPFGTQIP